ncbi:MAG: SDR family oxidoreductase [Gammaproteobacteria bacterium]|jgi:NAD(P)-dependent dehydrogenase (short-subunit alcohol dehydrogenase family)|nr:SDR family oxidoreductase [Gammaproteobacteria bacterium]
MSLFDLNGKVALVTGASSGIGQRQAQALATAGASVVLLGRRQQQLDDTVAQLATLGASTAALAVDLDDREQLAEVAARAALPFGAIDILINAAGVNLRQAVDEITLESWDQTINLNLTVPFFLARELLPAMRSKGWGRIINIASLQSSRAFANGLAYGASKGGIAQLTRAMAEAWSADGINCNAIAPGFFPTGLTAPVYQNPVMLDKLAGQTAIGRNGELADLDGISIFLASAASDYITGQVIHLDGGFTAK